MKREDAIEQLAIIKLKELTAEERDEQLDVMKMEDWSESLGWDVLPESIREEFKNPEPLSNPEHEKYDAVLLIWLRESLQTVTNSALEKQLNVNKIEGVPVLLHPCPCCGSRTISERGIYDICKVCWWEDDGQDNKDANESYGGPNYSISLTQGRFNFLKFGIYDPSRTDLLQKREPESLYEKGRTFKLDGEYVIEEGTNWKGKVNE